MQDAGSNDPIMQDIPIGLSGTGKRHESDSMGTVEVPADRYSGVQTQRSLYHSSIAIDRMPKAVYHAYGYVKKACALVNQAAVRLPAWKHAAVVRAADETKAGKLDEHFPLYVWQTGSSAQSNTNVNEVISNRAIQLLGGELGSQQPIRPDEDVNMGQSSNDGFPTATHIAAMAVLDDRLIPELDKLAQVIERKAAGWMDVVKIGRTHLEDAVPLSVGQEWSGWGAQLCACISEIERSRDEIYELALAGTAVGTGLNAPKGLSKDVAAKIVGRPASRSSPRPTRSWRKARWMRWCAPAPRCAGRR
jgi:fumarate hydratase, class II